MIYGGLYLILFLTVGILSAVKTYKAEKAKILKRKRAFQRRPGAIETQGAGVELTEEEIQKIRTNKLKLKDKLSNRQQKHTELAIRNNRKNNKNKNNDEKVEEEEDIKYEPPVVKKITVEEWDHTTNGVDSRKTTMDRENKYSDLALDSPTFESQQLPAQQQQIPSAPLSPITQTSNSTTTTNTTTINMAPIDYEDYEEFEEKKVPRRSPVAVTINTTSQRMKLGIPNYGEDETSITVDDVSVSGGTKDEDSGLPMPTENPIGFLEEDDMDDYYSKHSSLYEDDPNGLGTPSPSGSNNGNKKKKCCCNDFCYIIFRTDFLKNWPKETWQLRTIYGTIIVYLSDYITDINIAVLWTIDAYQQYHGNPPDNGLNMILMASLCLGVLAMHKIVSGIAVWRATKWYYGILQFLDFYIFIEVYRSHLKGHKTDRLRWLSNLESVLEASLQVLLQLVYLLQSQGNINSIVLLGLFFSVMKLGNTAINNDAVHVTLPSNKVMQYRWWIRAFYRVFELAGREFMFVLMWLIIGEGFLLMVLIIEIIHNTFLFLGGCLSQQVVNIIAHIVALAQLSYTIVEGKPIGFFKKGYLDEKGGNTRDSRLQLAYSIFIKDFNEARINQAAERKRKKQEERMNKKGLMDLPSPSGPSTVTPIIGDARSFSDYTLKHTAAKPIVSPGSPTSARRESSTNGVFTLDSPDAGIDFSVTEENDQSDQKKPNNKRQKSSHGDAVPELSASGSNRPNSPTQPKKASKDIGKLQLIAVDENRGLDDSERRRKKDMGDITKYEPSTGPLTGCYSYIAWIQMFMVYYLNIYLSSEKPQLRMMYQRTGLQLFWLIIIGLHGSIPGLRKNEGRWKTEHHVYVSFSFDNPFVILVYIISILFTILSMIFFWLLIEMDIINQVKKKEEIKFKSIYDAIYYGRLDAIINQFDKPKHLTSSAKDGKSPLYYAAELKQTEIAEWLIGKKCVDINVGANQNRTPLYIAARVGAYEIVVILLGQPGCKYNEPNSLGRTPLYAACREGRYLIVVELLKQPLIDVNHLTKHKSCALAAACQHGYADIVKELLKKPEIEINQLNESNYTPIFIAALGTHSEIVKILLEREEIEIDKGAKNDETLFYVSCERGMDEIVQILIDREDYHVDINKPNSKNYTPLYIAACFGHAKIIEILMGIDKSTLNQCDNIGRTPFFVACRKGNAAAVFKLLEYEDIDIHKKDQDELTPFAAACQGGSVPVVEKLMKLVDRSEIIGVDRMKRTPFFMACREGQTAVVERLMLEDNIIDINQPDKLARTPLMVCVKRAHNECVGALCKNKKIDINQPDHQGRSPLFVAAKNGQKHAECVKALMSRTDLFINAKSSDGKTALHIACQEGHSSIVMLLLDHEDIDVNEPDDTGTSPLAIANKNLDNNVYMRMVMISMRD